MLMRKLKELKKERIEIVQGMLFGSINKISCNI